MRLGGDRALVAVLAIATTVGIGAAAAQNNNRFNWDDWLPKAERDWRFKGPDATDPLLLKQLPFDRSPAVKLNYEQGGAVHEHYNRFKEMAARNVRVEVLDDCMSACTLVVSNIKKENLCFGPDAVLKFHMARNAKNLEASADTTKWMYDTYPANIRAWIDARGGWQKIPYSGWFYLYANELWKMGYHRCH